MEANRVNIDLDLNFPSVDAAAIDGIRLQGYARYISRVA